MINAETRVQIRHLFFAGHWKIGTIACELGVHADAVRHAIESDRFNRTMLDRLLHQAEVTVIEGSSYRVRESEQETTARRRRKK
jgi:hypothetical protein